MCKRVMLILFEPMAAFTVQEFFLCSVAAVFQPKFSLCQLGNANVDCMMQNREQAGFHTLLSNKIRNKSSLLKRKLSWKDPCTIHLLLPTQQSGYRKHVGWHYHLSRTHEWMPSAGISLPGDPASLASGSHSITTPRSPSQPAPGHPKHCLYPRDRNMRRKGKLQRSWREDVHQH